MLLVLGTRASRIFAVLLILLALYCAYLSFCSFRAAGLSRSGTLEDVDRAVQIEPENAEYWRQLGLLRLYEQDDFSGSLHAFRRATALNPRDADSWIGAAYAYQYLDDPDREREALEKAEAAEPKRLEVAWQAGNLYAVLGDRRASRDHLCIVVEYDSRRADAAIQLVRRMVPAADVGGLNCGPPERSP